MSDLHAAIRERLEMHPTAMPVTDMAMSARVNAWLASAADACMAILDLHKSDGGKWPNCVECSCSGALAATDCHQTVNWPCPTVQAIGEALGTEGSGTP